jgi:hypothetical protein
MAGGPACPGSLTRPAPGEHFDDCEGFSVCAELKTLGMGASQGAVLALGFILAPGPRRTKQLASDADRRPRTIPMPYPGPARSLFPLCDWPDEGGPAMAGQRTLPRHRSY